MPDETLMSVDLQFGSPKDEANVGCDEEQMMDLPFEKAPGEGLPSDQESMTIIGGRVLTVSYVGVLRAYCMICTNYCMPMIVREAYTLNHVGMMWQAANIPTQNGNCDYNYSEDGSHERTSS